jgi:uncharacterized protein YjbI with pentapeptide repeats
MLPLFVWVAPAYLCDAVARVAPLVLALLLLALSADPAGAGCTDGAEPGVEWRRCVFDAIDLKGRDISRAAIRDSSFDRANLAGANLTDADGYRARFINANLAKARLDGAVLAEADFTRADLTGASLARTDLRRAKFFRANLRGADLSQAQTRGADFLDADLSDALWIDGKRRCAEGSISQCN